MSFKKEILLVFFISAFMLNGPIPAAVEAQQDYPSRPLKMYIPFDPGGSTDLFSRALADAASKILKQPIEPLNKAGGEELFQPERLPKRSLMDIRSALYRRLPFASHPISAYFPIILWKI